ncbi:MAG: HAMP domain-containing histidine kinase [Tannerella sp.]|nr:HAMP domain-containing histidine kinase [Tannerella sp.]
MKLRHYTIRNLSVPLLIIMVAWACMFYFLILHEVNDETNDSLQNYKEIIIKQFLADSTQLSSKPDVMTRYYIRPIPAEEANLAKDEFYDSTKLIEIEMEYEPIRVLRTNFMSSGGNYYELKIETSTLEKEDLIETVFWSIVLLYFLLSACILYVTQFVFKKSFKPLYTILKWLDNFHPGKPIKPLKNETVIDEFAILNKAVTEATNRSVSLYQQQKQFVENASHELQTPLAVCVNKLELLSENPDCTEEQLAEIEGLHTTLQGIIKQNKSLLLLSRIDNKQYTESKTIHINELAKKIVETFSEIYEKKNIRVTIIEKETLTFEMNESLAATMLTNLVKNAFVHNISGGDINIIITNRNFTIENSSGQSELAKEKLFQRFNKQTNRPDSTGLGLAIVKSIASMYEIDIQYNYYGRHQFILTFK